MPDLDRFEKRFTAGWRDAFNYVREGIASDSQISDKLMKSLAQDLRKFKGIPGLHEILAVVKNGSGASLDESFVALDRIVRDHNGHRHAKVVAGTAQSTIVSQKATNTEDASLNTDQLQFVSQSLNAIVAHKFFGNARQYLIEEGNWPDQRAADWQHRLENVSLPAIKGIASQLLDDSRVLSRTRSLVTASRCASADRLCIAAFAPRVFSGSWLFTPLDWTSVTLPLHTDTMCARNRRLLTETKPTVLER